MQAAYFCVAAKKTVNLNFESIFIKPVLAIKVCRLIQCLTHQIIYKIQAG